MGSLTRRHRKASRPEPVRVRRGNSSRPVSVRAPGPSATPREPSLSDSLAAIDLSVDDALVEAFRRGGIPRTSAPQVLTLEESTEFRRLIADISVATQQSIDVQPLLGLFNVELTDEVAL